MDVLPLMSMSMSMSMFAMMDDEQLGENRREEVPRSSCHGLVNQNPEFRNPLFDRHLRTICSIHNKMK